MRLTKRSRDGIWMVDYTDPDTGARKRVSTGARERAEAERQAQFILAGEGKRAPEYTLTEALDYAWEERWERSKNGSRFRYVVELVRKDLGHWQCKDITYAVLAEYATQMRKDGLSPATINNRMIAVSVSLELAEMRGLIRSMPKVPRQSTKGNARMRVVSLGEETRLIEAAAVAGEPQMQMLTIVLLDTGCRLSEITGSRYEWIVGNTLRIPAEAVKTGKPRSIPLTRRALVSLRWLLADERWRGICAGVGRTERGKENAKDWCVKRFTRVRNEAKLPDVSIHVLRHTCASRLVERGIDLYRVKEWLGHSTITMTERYSHFKPDALADVVSVLERAPAVVEGRKQA